MANNQAQPAKKKEVKFYLGDLFVDAPVKVEPVEKQKILVAGLAEAHPKKDYPDNFFGRAFAVLKGEFQTLLKSSLFFILFTVPFIVMLAWFANYYEDLILSNTYNFMGSIGVGYPGNGDSLPIAISRLYWDVKEPVAGIVAAAIFFASIGLGGQFYCAKRSYFQDYYKKTVSTYWMGFAKYWWQYMVLSLFVVAVGYAMATSVINILAQQAIGAASAGDYVGAVFAFLFGAPLLLVPFVMLGLIVSYDLTFGQAMKDAIVIIANQPVTCIMIALCCLAPALICIAGQIISLIVYVVMVIIGFNAIALYCIALADRGMKICKIKKAQTMKKQQVVYGKSVKDGQAKSNAKKKAAPAPYVNPKKKKKK